MGCAAKKPSKEVQRTEKMIVEDYNNQEKGSTVEFHYIEEGSIQEYLFFKEQAVGKEISDEEKNKLKKKLKEAIQPAYFVACKNEKGEWEGVVNLYILNTYKEMIGLLTDVLIDPKIDELATKVFKGKLIVRAAISLAFEAYNCDRVIFDGEESLFQALTDLGKNNDLGLKSSITLETYKQKKEDKTFSTIVVPLVQEEEGNNISSALLYPFKKFGETMIFVGKSAVSVSKSAAETVVHAGETVIINPLKTAGKAVVDTGDKFLVSPISNAISGKRDKEDKENKEEVEDKEEKKDKEEKEDKEDKEDKENKVDNELEKEEKIKTEEHAETHLESHTTEKIEVNELKGSNDDDVKFEENDEKLEEKDAKLSEEKPIENREEKVEESEEAREKKENQQ